MTAIKNCLPSLQKGHDSTHEEQPDAPTRGPEPTTRSLSDRARIEPIVDQMLEVLRHAHLPHELILVPVHACKGTNVRKDILQGVGQLEGVDIAETELNVSIDN
jgi:hypothetical protein